MLIKSKFSIKELEALSGIKAHTLRIWEQRYNILEPKRTPTNIRYYDNDDLKELLIISFLNRNGMRISKISELNCEERRKKAAAILEKEVTYDQQVDGLAMAMVDLDELKFEKILSRSVLQFGFENTIEEIIFPFLRRVGVMWMTNNVHPAQEHFITNLIRQKLIVAIDGQEGTINGESEKFILFLPEGELHEIGLLYLYYVLKKNGKRVIYLGYDVPMDDIAAIQEIFDADYLFTIITSSPAPKKVLPFLQELSEIANQSTVVVSGVVPEKVIRNKPDNILYLEKMKDVHNYLKKSSFTGIENHYS